MPLPSDMLDQMSFGGGSGRVSPASTFSRRSGNRDGYYSRPISPLGSSRYEGAFDLGEYRSRRAAPPPPPPPLSPHLHRSSSRRSPRPSRRSPTLGTFGPGIGLGIDLQPPSSRRRREESEESFSRLYDSQRTRPPPRRDYLETLGSGYDGRDPRCRRSPEPELVDLSSLAGGPPMRYGPGYGGPSSRRDGRPTAAEYLDGMNSRGWRDERRDRGGEGYVLPRDDNRYVYPSGPPGESRRERRGERREDRRDRRWF